MSFPSETESIALEKRRACELYEAVRASDEHRVRDLIAAGCDVHEVVDWDDTSLELAIRQQNDTVAILLMSAGARLELPERESVFQLALKNTALRRTAVALIKAAGEDLPEVKDDMGSTALHLAIGANNAQAAQLLLERGVPIDELNAYDETAFFTSVDLGHRDLTKILLSHGATWDITKRDGRNVLDVAPAKNDVQMAELLLGHLYSAWGTTGAGDPALDSAIRKMDLEEALRLLNDGRSLVRREVKRIYLDG